MARQAKQALGVEELTVLADGGYFEGNALKECEQSGITTYLPLPKSGGAKRRGIFERKQFRYDEERDLFVCPKAKSCGSGQCKIRAASSSSSIRPRLV